ncbi:TonB-dependent receptor [Sphingomonas sp. Tas61C01]|uniref:TonB-dependent receptor n=1 Tax=Sphingomonas sp. Tas61C01 TaxID=3458297 RepID=UPI00403EA785
MIDVTSRRAGLYAAASLTALVLASAASAQQTSTTQGVIANPPGGTAASPSAETAQQTGDATAEDAGPDIVVTGIRAAQARAISVKRNAAQVVDSISAEDIGKLPDVTISDSLQRIPGVQIRRDAGEGAAVNIRGLPQVSTLLNGESFLGANSITTVQPNFNDIPSQLFAGADVIKSATADLLNAGITGTVNLRTRRPFDLKRGFTAAGTLEGDYGDKVKKWDPNVNGLVGYHGDRFGALVSAAYSDLRLSNQHNGIQEGYGVGLHNEGYDDVTSTNGFSPPNRRRGTPVGNVPATATSPAHPAGYDVNGDGDINDTFLTPQAHTAWNRQTQRQRLGINGSFQAELTDQLELTADAFFTKQTQYDRTAGFQFQNVNWQAGEFLPGSTRDTGAQIGGYNLNTIGVYNYDLPNFDSYAETIRTQSKSQNYNLELKYDDGDKFKVTVRGLYGKANQDQNQSYVQFNLSNGAQWNNGIGHYPTGDVQFNPGAYTVSTVAGLNSLPAKIDFTGNQPVFTLPQQLTTELADINSYALKTISSENNFRRDGDLKVLRLDGEYKFNEQINLTFGARYNERSVEDFEFERAAPLYAGVATNPAGCLVKWKAFDVRLTDPSCSAGTGGDANGDGAQDNAYTAGITRKANDPSFNGAVKQYNLPVGGVPAIYVLDPHAMDDALAFNNAFYPGNVETVLPGRSFGIDLKQTSGYAQGNFDVDIGIPFRGNFGLKVIQTKFRVRQNITGVPQPYGVAAVDAGDIITKRSFTDVLPSFNMSFDFRPDVRLRLAYSRTMTLLDLNQWGGGFDVNYAIDTSVNPPIFRVTGGNSNGNPQLDPWRADNFDASLEWYVGRSSLLSAAVFYIDVASFIQQGSIQRTDLPDNDGVVRNRTVTISTPIQGAGGTLKGVELGAKLVAADFGMNGLLGKFGVDANFTYSPSDSGFKDLAGDTIPFQDNSRFQGNAALFFEGGGLSARVAYNYRSKRAVSQNFGGITGLELYQQPTNYFDATVSYDVNSNLTVFGQASNFTGEYEKYYLTFPEEHAYNNIYERRFAAGVRVKF